MATKAQGRAGESDARETADVAAGADATSAVAVHLGYRPPYEFGQLLDFFRTRAIGGVEIADDEAYTRTVRIQADDGAVATGWVRVEDEPARSALRVTVSESLLGVLSQVVGRIRRQFDLDSDPQAVSAGLASMADVVTGCPHEGTRLPGCFDAFETTCRAVIGQQVTVKAASSIASRIATTCGAPVNTGIEGLGRAWPTPAEVVGLADAETTFGELGLIKSRTRSIVQIAQMLVEGELALDSAAPVEEQMERLLAVKGIGPWTANYVAMRALGYTDAFLETDVGVAHALPDLAPKERLALAEQWRPWRSYAVINLWNSLAEG